MKQSLSRREASEGVGAQGWHHLLGTFGVPLAAGQRRGVRLAAGQRLGKRLVVGRRLGDSLAAER